MPYTLITVTYGGEINHSRGYETLTMCQEARSIALTGMRIAENEKLDRQYEEFEREKRRRRDEKLIAEWRAAHPPRHPTNLEMENIRRLKLEWDCGSGSERGEYFHVSPTESLYLRTSKSRLGADGLVYDDYKIYGGGSSGMSMGFSPNEGEAVEYIRGGWVKKHRHDVKSAHCVLEAPDTSSPGLAA